MPEIQTKFLLIHKQNLSCFLSGEFVFFCVSTKFVSAQKKHETVLDK